MRTSSDRRLSLCLIVILLIPMISIFIGQVHAGSQQQWAAQLPSTDALLNQTLVTYKHDNYAEVGLGANLYVLQKDYPQPGQYEFALAVVAGANSRYAMGYSVTYGQADIYIFNTQTLTLGDNQGVWINAPDLITYYGAWYDRVFVSSNGFVVLDQRAYDDSGGIWTSPTPKAIPSIDDPNVLIAPFWRDLDPSRGGSIKYGVHPGGGTVILWENVPNKYNSNTQTFAVWFEPSFTDGSIQFLYESITNDATTSIGIEDQTGKRGISIPSVSSGQTVNFAQNSPGNFKCITQIKISASKLLSDGRNDDSAVINVDGLNNALPGGMNVELFNQEEGTYADFPILAATGVVLGVAALAPGWGLLGTVGIIVGVADLVFQLSPVPSSVIHEADLATQTAYTLNIGEDENRPDLYPRDVAAFVLFRWRLLNPSVVHRLILNVQVDYGWPTGSHTLTSENLELNLTPCDVDWYGRTNPDTHSYNFYPISTPYGEGYHIDSSGNNDYGYQMLGWNRLIDDALVDHKVGADGKIRIKGYFRLSDMMPSPLWPEGRRLNIYVMYSENLDHIVKTVRVLDQWAGTEWKYKALIIDGLIPDKPIKIGIGREDSLAWDYNLAAEWAGIEIYSGAGSPPLIPPLRLVVTADTSALHMTTPQ